MVNYIWNYYPDIFRPLILKTNGNVIGPVIVQPGERLYFFLGIPADFLAIL